eukprot:49674-Pleurochrysis_carterae.AAC.1
MAAAGEALISLAQLQQCWRLTSSLSGWGCALDGDCMLKYWGMCLGSRHYSSPDIYEMKLQTGKGSVA